MEKEFDNQTRKIFGILLVLTCIGGIFYSSYRIKMGFTDIGVGFIEFIERTADQWQFSAEWDLAWLGDALKKFVHIVAYILFGFFTGVVFAWWGIVGRGRIGLVVLAAALVAMADEGFQSLVLYGTFHGWDVIWDLAGAFVGFEILRFMEFTNRE